MDDLKTDRIVMFQLEYYYILVMIFSILLPTLVPYYFWNETIAISFSICFALRYVWTLHMTWFVNSAAHLWGYRPYDKDIMPRENWFVVLVALGEGFHNYHHTFPNDYAASEFGSKYNLTTAFIDLCISLGLAYAPKCFQKNIILKKKHLTRQKMFQLLF